jgi:hypothetical protein
MGRHCTICTSPRRSAVDAQLAGGESLAAVAKRYKLSPDALRRHREGHLSPALAAVAVERYGAESAAAAFDQTTARIESLIARLEGLLEVAEERKSLLGGANIAREIRQSLELIARLRGELDERPVTTVVNVLASPEFTAAVTAMLTATERYPEARVAIADALERLDAMPALPAGRAS